MGPKAYVLAGEAGRKMENHSLQILEKPIERRRVCRAAISYDLREHMELWSSRKSDTRKKEYDYGFPISGPLKAENY